MKTYDLVLVMKLTSIIVHLEEFCSVGGFSEDREAARSIMSDPEVKEVFADFEKQAFLPLRRDGVRCGP
jgi:hypothetical protein